MELNFTAVFGVVLLALTTFGQELNPRQKTVQAYLARHPLGAKQKEYNLEVLFFDFNGNGIEDEALVADNFNRDHSGNSWNYVRRDGSGVHDDWEDEEMHYSLFCRPDKLYVAEFSHSVKRLVGRDVGLYFEGGSNNKNDTYSSHNDVMLHVAPDGRLAQTKIKSDFSDIVANPGFVKIGSVQTEFYDKHCVKITTNSVHEIVNKSEPSDKTGLFDNVKFRNFIARYRNDMESNGGNCCVYLIVFDAEGDGDSDFYISNDSRRRNDGKYLWELILQDEKGFSKLEKPVAVNRDSDFIYGRLHPSERSTLDGFYRFSASCSVVRFPFVFTMDFKDKTALPIHNIMVKDDFGAYEECRLTKLFDFFSGVYVTMERLPCEVLQFKDAKPRKGDVRDNLHCRNVDW